MGQAGNRGWGSERRATGPRRPRAGRFRAGARGTKSLPAAGSLLPGTQFRPADPGLEQKLRAGVKQTHARASLGRSAFPQGPGDKAAGHVPLSPAARAPHAHCWGAAARLVYLFVVYSSPRARAWQHPVGRGERGSVGRSQNFLPGSA